MIFLFYCVNCTHYGHLSVHGLCAKCGSDSVVPEGHTDLRKIRQIEAKYEFESVNGENQ